MALTDLKGRKVTLHDMCLRDGMHPKRHQMTLNQMRAVATHCSTICAFVVASSPGRR